MKKIASLLAELEQNNRNILEITERNQTIRFEIQNLLSPKETKVEDKQPAPTFTKEDVRKVLASKASDGFKNEVKALLVGQTGHNTDDKFLFVDRQPF
jgi:hypothetical protein